MFKENRLLRKHAFEFIATGDGFYVKDGQKRKQVITQAGELVAAAYKPQQYCILKPGVSATGSVNAQDISGGGIINCTLVRRTMDYPRNLLYTLVDAAGDTLEAVFVTVGTDQFGVAATETLTVDYNVAATKAGDQIFATITSITCTPTNHAASDTASVGVTIAADVASFGLPDGLTAVADVKSVNWIDNGVTKAETIDATSIVLARNAFRPKQTVEVIDDYVISYIVSRA